MEKSKVISPNIKDDLIGAKVKHKIFGTGTITSIEKDTEKDRGFLRVKFATGEHKFVYPDAFERFLAAEDPDIQRRMIEEIQKLSETVFIDTTRDLPPERPKDILVFTDKKITYGRASGYAVYNLSGNEVGVVWNPKRKTKAPVEEQAEILFYSGFPEYCFNFQWRRVSIDHQKISFAELEKMIKDHGSVTLSIDYPIFIY